MNELLTRLDEAYKGLQTLMIQPTRPNLDILLAAFSAMEAAHAYIRNHPDPEPEEEEEKTDV